MPEDSTFAHRFHFKISSRVTSHRQRYSRVEVTIPRSIIRPGTIRITLLSAFQQPTAIKGSHAASGTVPGVIRSINALTNKQKRTHSALTLSVQTPTTSFTKRITLERFPIGTSSSSMKWILLNQSSCRSLKSPSQNTGCESSVSHTPDGRPSSSRGSIGQRNAQRLSGR